MRPPLLHASAALLALLAAAPGPVRAEGGDDPPPPAKEDAREESFDRKVGELEEFPRKAPAGSTFRLRFRLKYPYVGPTLVVVFPDGKPVYIQKVDRVVDSEYEMSFPLDPRGGTHRVSLLAHSAWGDRYAAQFQVRATGRDGKEIDRDIDLPPEDAVYPALDLEEHPLRLEKVLYHRMNHFRKGSGLPPLPWHEGVARCARKQMEDLAKHWEETLNPRTGLGRIVHSLPGSGPHGEDGPTIAGRAQDELGWPVVLPNLPPARPSPARNGRNFVSEVITSPATSLDAKFEQFLLRKSDYRAPMLSAFLTHAAGAATWRWYGWKEFTGPEGVRMREPGPAPPGKTREVLAILAFVQMNDPAAAEAFEKEKREVRAAIARASLPAERADALRALGRYAFPESPRLLREAAKGRDPAVGAGALDGLWLCDPDGAQDRADEFRVRVLRALEGNEECLAAEPLALLGLVRYDAESGREARKAAAEVKARARAALDAAAKAAAAGRVEEARVLFGAARKRFDGFPEAEEEAAAGLKALGPSPPPEGGK